jgi:hypothetical protein
MPKDKYLFAVTRWCLAAAAVVTALLTVILIGGTLWATLAWQFGFFSGRFVREVTLSFGSMHAAFNSATDVTGDEMTGVALVALAGATTFVFLVHLILRAIHRVVVSTSIGDPFIARNATDISRVAWLWIGVQVTEVLTMLAAYGVAPAAARTKFDSPVDITGLFAALLILVLARVFRRGTEMRADLQGTV